MSIRYVVCLILCSALAATVGARVERVRWAATFASLQAEHTAREGKRDAEFIAVFEGPQSGTSTVTKQSRGK